MAAVPGCMSWRWAGRLLVVVTLALFDRVEAFANVGCGSVGEHPESGAEETEGRPEDLP